MNENIVDEKRGEVTHLHHCPKCGRDVPGHFPVNGNTGEPSCGLPETVFCHSCISIHFPKVTIVGDGRRGVYGY